MVVRLILTIAAWRGHFNRCVSVQCILQGCGCSGPPLPWSWLLQRQKKRITPILRPYHLFTQITMSIHICCNEYREHMSVLSMTYGLKYNNSVATKYLWMWQLLTLRGCCSPTIDSRTGKHNFAWLMANNCKRLCIVFSNWKGFWILFLCVNHIMWGLKMVGISF